MTESGPAPTDTRRDLFREFQETLDRKDPRFGNGTLMTKFFTHEINEENLDRSTLYLSYFGDHKDGDHTTSFGLRSSFNQGSDRLPFWFAEASAKTATKKGAFAFRAIINPNAYFLASYKHHFSKNFTAKAGIETEIRSVPKYFVKLHRSFQNFGLLGSISGQLNRFTSYHNCKILARVSINTIRNS